jgi:Outer membrane protein beta-barrel domain
MKHVFVLAAALFICLQSITAQEAVGFKYKNEIELRSVGFGISNSGFNLNASLLYRRFLSEKFALQSEFGFNVSDLFTNYGGLSSYRFNQFNMGLGAAYFVNKSHNGLYFTTMLTYSAAPATSRYGFNSYWAGRVGVGYRIGIGKHFYVSPELNTVFYGNHRISSQAAFSVGVKF